MTEYVFKHRRKKNGQIVVSRYWSGCYGFPGDLSPRTIALHTTDKQVAKAKLRQIVYDEERERVGLVAPKSIREALQQPLVEQMEEYFGERLRLGRNGKYVEGLRLQVTTLIKECGWNVVRDVSRESFCAWRKRQIKSAKTLNEYLAAVSSLLNWLERAERIPKNPLRGVEKIKNHGDPVYERRALTLEQVRRLLAVAGPRRAVYATALETGLRRGELEQLEWHDVHLDGSEPFLNVRQSTTKNGKAASIPIDTELADELRKLRPEALNPKHRVFGKLIPRMNRFRLDLLAAGIAPVDGAGRRVDFHALRMTFQMLLTLNGTAPRVVMELLRHSDMRLTAKTYTDAGMLPTGDAVRRLPSLLGTDAKYTVGSTVAVVSESQVVSPDVTPAVIPDHPETGIDKGVGHNMASLVAESHKPEDGARCRVRTCDFLRVKQALYR